MITQGTRVAVIDDVYSYAETTAGIAEEAGLEPSIISERDGRFRSTDELLAKVRDFDCSAVICDHRLSHTPFATFTGAEFLSNIYQETIPGLLLSTFTAADADTSIRLHRSDLPSVIDREVLDPNQLMVGLLRCEAELLGEITPERQTWRTLVRVERVDMERDDPVVEAILHNWDSTKPIRFPLATIEDGKIADALTANSDGTVRLFAEVNIGCSDESELFFRAFEFAPEANLDDLRS